MKQNLGFTIVELLVMIASIGLLLSIGGVILNSIRLNSTNITSIRDARRLQDLTSLRTALELYLSQAGGYPDLSLWHAGGKISCGTGLLIAVPNDPLTTNPYQYQAKGASTPSKSCGNAPVWTAYSVQFSTEGISSLGPAGAYCLTSARGFIVGACPLK